MLKTTPLPEEYGAAKKVRATMGGITARRLAAHRRLIAAISELGCDMSCFFSEPVIGALFEGTLVASIAGVGDLVVKAIGGAGDNARDG